MKRIIMVVCLLFIIILTGCSNYKPITYTKFSEFFKGKEDYIIIDQTSKYEDKFERCLEANGKSNQFFYYEFKTEKAARKYLEDNYKNRKKFKYRDRKKYISVKCSSNMYFYAIQSDKMVIVGVSSTKRNKREINRIFKELDF